MTAHLNQQHKDYLILLLISNPTLSNGQIKKEFNERFPGQSLTDKQIIYLKQKEGLAFKFFTDNSTLAIEKALEIGLLRYSHKLARLKVLERVVDLGLNGYIEQVQTSKGTVVDLHKVNLPVVVQAVKSIKEEMDELNINNESNYEINITLTDPIEIEGEDDDESLSP
ncbi:hypothetical protein [Calothrix parietina]|nr:hypothetical protein [Calothrix parietina FACHB-288]